MLLQQEKFFWQTQLYILLEEKHDSIILDSSITTLERFYENHIYNAREAKNISENTLNAFIHYVTQINQGFSKPSRTIEEVVFEMEELFYILEEKERYFRKHAAYTQQENLFSKAIDTYNNLIIQTENNLITVHEDTLEELIKYIQQDAEMQGAQNQYNTEITTDELLVAAAIQQARNNTSTLILTRDKHVLNNVYAYAGNTNNQKEILTVARIRNQRITDVASTNREYEKKLA
ncbi:MAG: hypothetical protein ACMXYD_01270 [Candidatus Woesearchaeota archaeon]